MRSLWLLLAGCAADPTPPPPIPDGIYKVVSVSLPTNNLSARDDAALLDDKGIPSNELGMAVGYLSSAELTATASVDVQLALADDILTLIDHGVSGTPKPLQYEHGWVTAGGATATATIAISGVDPVQVDLVDATVRLDPSTMAGALGGVVPTGQKSARLIPAAVAALNVQVAKDCQHLDDPVHDCGCRSDSNGLQILSFMIQQPGLHCVITRDDLLTSAYGSLLDDDVPDGITLGMAITTERQ